MFIGFAMTQFIAPIAAVMFPTIVRNMALSKKTDALLLTLAVTGGFACLAATGCTLFPKLPLAILFPDKIGASVLVPSYVWVLVPLALANVLIQNLLARGRFAATPWLMPVPILYVLTLLAFESRLVALPDDFSAFKVIIHIMGFFCLLLFGVAAWFTWRKPVNEVSDPGFGGGAWSLRYSQFSTGAKTFRQRIERRINPAQPDHRQQHRQRSAAQRHFGAQLVRPFRRHFQNAASPPA